MLTERQAAACENAKTPRCRCACGGAFHGAARVPGERLADLPKDDPHHPAPDQTALQAAPGRTISPTPDR